MELSFGGWNETVTVLVAPASTLDFIGSIVKSLECGFEEGRASMENSPVT